MPSIPGDPAVSKWVALCSGAGGWAAFGCTPASQSLPSLSSTQHGGSLSPEKRGFSAWGLLSAPPASRELQPSYPPQGTCQSDLGVSEVPSSASLVLPDVVRSSTQPLGCGQRAGQQSLPTCSITERRRGTAGPVPTAMTVRSQNMARNSQEESL